ncbi:hypothetical protein [Sporolactobacillus putidus]|uniref:Uncharacterized protein n=1 Tax=Sporolactobacillus putidus TaxID=492735 RepID=A0A917RW91_9BACL|nr:hypothetical protein [Sporolactobacillus putidus]GGL41548.1 hypothetical protein GCM10007968_01790 [Sporolactobacillus putidus]
MNTSSKLGIEKTSLLRAESARVYLNRIYKKSGKFKSNKDIVNFIDKLAKNHTKDELKYLNDAILGEIERHKNAIVPSFAFVTGLFGIILTIENIFKIHDVTQPILISLVVLLLFYYFWKQRKDLERLYAYSFCLQKSLQIKNKEWNVIGENNN